MGGTLQGSSARTNSIAPKSGKIQASSITTRPTKRAWMLGSAGLVRGHTLSSYHIIQGHIRDAGGDWTDREVVHDRNW